MIRVVYRWSVDRLQADAFVAAWREATRHIQQAWPAAHGSFLLRSELDPGGYIAVARWDSVEAWKAYRAAPSVVPEAIAAAIRRAAPAPPSHEIFEEVCDWAPDQVEDPGAQS